MENEEKTINIQKEIQWFITWFFEKKCEWIYPTNGEGSFTFYGQQLSINGPVLQKDDLKNNEKLINFLKNIKTFFDIEDDQAKRIYNNDAVKQFYIDEIMKKLKSNFYTIDILKLQFSRSNPWIPSRNNKEKIIKFTDKDRNEYDQNYKFKENDLKIVAYEIIHLLSEVYKYEILL
jgi:hypothetical protein